MDEVTQAKFKSFWEKPEGKTGMFVIAGLGAFAFIKLLPWMIMMATNTLHLMLLLGAIGVVLFLFTNSQVRATASVAFQLLMRKITGLIVKIDPLEILKMKVREMEDNLERMGESIGKLKEVIQRLGRKIAQNKQTLESSIQKATYAKKQGETDQIFLQTRRAGRMQRSNMTLQSLYDKMDGMHRVLTKIQKNSAVIIADTKDEIDVTTEEYLATRAAHGAMKSALSIINGNRDKRAIYELAYEEITNDIVSKSADLEQMLDMSDSLMKNIDLENGMMQEQGLTMIEEWEKKADNWLVSTTKKSDAISKVTDLTMHKQPVEPAASNNNQFSNLFRQ
jgi:peptidyl-tRNA hydrolase